MKIKYLPFGLFKSSAEESAIAWPKSSFSFWALPRSSYNYNMIDAKSVFLKTVENQCKSEKKRRKTEKIRY